MSRVVVPVADLERLLRQRQAKLGAPVVGALRFVAEPAKGGRHELVRVEFDVEAGSDRDRGWG